MYKIILNNTRVSLLASFLVWLSLIIPLQAFSAEKNTTTPKEYLLKAVCLYNFTKFSHWPATKESEQNKSLTLGIVGDSPFGNALQELQTSLAEKGHNTLSVIYHGPYQEGMNLKGNHILFISSSEKNKMKQIIASLGNAPVLTVSDTDVFLAAGGMISLVLMNNKVRWGINRTAIDMSGIKVSSKLFQLAIQIEDHRDQSKLFPNPFDDKTPWLISQRLVAVRHEIFQPV